MPAPIVVITEARGVVPLPDPGVDSRAVVMGCASSGTDLACSLLYGSSGPVATDYGQGPLPSALGHTLTRTRVPAAALKLPTDTEGSVLGSVDVTGVTGTAVIDIDDSVTKPRNDDEPWLEVIDGGTIGTAGITFRTSQNAGRKWSRKTRLGTADSYTVPNTGVKWTFSPASADLTALNTLINEIYTDFNAHVILVGGSPVHGSTGLVDVVSIASASSTATRIARVNAIRLAYIAHIARVSGSPQIHITADVTAADQLAYGAATDDGTALLLALDLKAKLNLHEANLTVHTNADATNTVTSAAPSMGVLVAGDIAKGVTTAPQWTSDDFAAAFLAIKGTSFDEGLIYLAGPCTKADALLLSAGLDVIETAGKEIHLICHTRNQGSSDANETEAAWMASIIADFDGFEDSRITVCAGAALAIDPVDGAEYMRTFGPALLARDVAIPISEAPSWVEAGPLEGVRLCDDTGALIAHDEGALGNLTGLDDERFAVLQRLPGRGSAGYLCHGRVMEADDERIHSSPARRVANAMKRDALQTALDELGGKVFYDPDTNTISDADIKAIASHIGEPLSRTYADHIQNPQDPDLVTVEPTVTIAGDDAYVSAAINPLFFKYKGKIGLSLAIKV